MRHDKSRFPRWRNASRDEVSQVFAPYSPYCLMSVAKLSRLCGYDLGNDRPVYVSRNKPNALPPKKRSGHDLHGRGCAACHPRHSRPRKPYKRASDARRLRLELEELT